MIANIANYGNNNIYLMNMFNLNQKSARLLIFKGNI